jgi:drug/metabolite transporter (DMT)-like permease
MIENRRKDDDDDDVIKDEKELETLVRPQLANKRLSRVTADLMVVIEPMSSINKSKKSNYIGVLLAFMSTLVVSGVPVFVKKALLFKAVEQSAIRYIVQFFVMLLVIAKNRLNPFGEAGNRRLLVLRGFFGMATLTCWYISLKFINPTDSIAISYTNVIIVFIFARFTLDEHFSIVHLIALFMAVSGKIFT